MTRICEIRKYVENLAREFNPDRVILFGSYARGEPSESSDVDLLVIMNHRRQKNVEQAIDINIHLDHSFPLDLIVRKPSEVRRRIILGDMFLRDIIEEGKVLYEHNSQGMGRKG